MTIMRYVKKIKCLNISNFDTSNVTTLKNMFNDFNELQYLDISQFTFENIYDIFYPHIFRNDFFKICINDREIIEIINPRILDKLKLTITSKIVIPICLKKVLFLINSQIVFNTLLGLENKKLLIKPILEKISHNAINKTIMLILNKKTVNFLFFKIFKYNLCSLL